MKIIILISGILFSLSVWSQGNQQLVTFYGIGEIKTGMTKPELEALLKTKLTAKYIGKSVRLTETIKSVYLGKPVELAVMKSEEESVFFLQGIKITGGNFTTEKGITMGSDHVKIINAYADQMMLISPDVKSGTTTSSTITVSNINNKHEGMIFYLKNKKVVAIEVCPTPMFLDQE